MIRMIKYDALWEYVKKSRSAFIKLMFDEIEGIAGVPTDHSFLKFKNNPSNYGHIVGKISMKNKAVILSKKDNQ